MPNRKGVTQRPGTSSTSPKAIALQKKRARALQLREEGKTYRQIAAEIGCGLPTAFDYVSEAIKQTIPAETAQQVLALEMQRLDALFERYNPDALNGDTDAAKIVLRVITERSRLCGLYPQNGQPNVLVNVGGDTNAPRVINIVGVPSPYEQRPDGSTWRDGKMVDPPHIDGATPLGQREHAYEARTIYPHQIEHQPEPTPAPARRPEAPPPTPPYNSGPPTAYATTGLNPPRVSGNPAPYMPPQPLPHSSDGPRPIKPGGPQGWMR